MDNANRKIARRAIRIVAVIGGILLIAAIAWIVVGLASGLWVILNGLVQP